MSAVAIPKRLGHIWIGDKPAPTRWLQSWRDLNPDWAYTLYDNVYLTGRRWRNQCLIARFFRQRRFEGVADLMRAEITDLHIWPAYFFVPKNKDKPRYDGPGRIYADHHWGTTLDKYEGAPDPQLFDDVAYVLDDTPALPLTAQTFEEP